MKLLVLCLNQLIPFTGQKKSRLIDQNIKVLKFAFNVFCKRTGERKKNEKLDKLVAAVVSVAAFMP